MKPTTIYCDESGFTGNNLLDQQQPFFVYAAVAVEPEQANGLIQKIRTDFSLQGNELKASNLKDSTKGQQAIGYLFKKLHHRTRIIVADKQYALGGKFFEYIFEPAIADQCMLFYECGFHEFIATLLFAMFKSKDKSGERLYEEFQAMIRGKTGTPDQFWAQAADVMPGPLIDIRDFCINNRQSLVEELDHTEDKSIDNWMLDLTSTSLYQLLCEQGEQFDALEVYCDDSKPLSDGILDILKPMIGRTDKTRHVVGAKNSAATFNLHQEIRFAQSVTTPGIQIADLMAGAMLSYFKFPGAWKQSAWPEYFPTILSDYSILPNLTKIDLSQWPAYMNAMILKELAERSRNGTPLLKDIGTMFAQMAGLKKEWERERLLAKGKPSSA